MENKNEKISNHRWVVLGIAWLSSFAILMAWYIMPTLEHDLVEMYKISPSQFSAALTFPFLIAGIMSIAGGILADQLGIRKSSTLGIFIAGIGVFTRAYVGGFMSIMVAMLFMGIGLGFVLPNLPKLVSVWFPPEETGLATGIYNTSFMGGLSTGLIIAPVLPGWVSGNITLGIIIIFLGIVFFAIVRDTPPGKELPSLALLDGLKAAVKSKNAWAASFGTFLGTAGMISVQGSYPAALNKVYGLSMAAGGQVASLITYSAILGSLTLPAIADRLKWKKLFFVLLVVGYPTMLLTAWLAGDNKLILRVGTMIGGYLAGGSLPMLMEVPTFLPFIKDDPVQEQHVGGASGLLTSLRNIGGFVGLPLLVMPVILRFGYTYGLLTAGIIFASQAIFGLMIDFPDRTGKVEKPGV